METPILISGDGHFYRVERTLFKTRFLRIGDDYSYPNPKDLRCATDSELKLLVRGFDPSKNCVPCATEMRLATSKESVSEEILEPQLKVGTLESPSEHYDWNRLVLYPSTVQSIRMAVNFIQKRAQMEETFNISQIDPSSKSLLNFYGPPGTGKTISAKAVARELGKPLLQADYSQITSKWVGETSKGIKLLFQEAKDLDAVLFLDEADSLASRRIENPSDSAGTHFNQEKNVFMQELDKFQGIVIMTTNLFQNYDEALLRRIAEHIKFDLPNTAMREQILRQFFVKTVNIQVNYSNLALITDGFSGGDLLNVAKNSIKLASLSDKNPAKWIIDDKTVSTVVVQIKESKQVAGKMCGMKPMGLHT